MRSEAFRRFSHQTRRFNAPISALRLARIVELMRAHGGSHVVDLGCGTGQWLVEITESSEARGTGVDTDELALEEAERRAEQRGLSHRVGWVAESAKTFLERAGRAFDRGICIGSSHAFGGYEQTLRALNDAVGGGGLILLGEGLWMREPPAEYVEFLEGTELTSHSENIQLAVDLGLEPIWATTADLDEWDEFEWAFYRVAVEYAAANPGEEADQLLQERRRWRDGYLEWGRGTMGFGYYLFRTAAHQEP